MLSDIARMVLYAHIASGEKSAVALMLADRWSAMQARTEILGMYLGGRKDDDEMFHLELGSCTVGLFFNERKNIDFHSPVRYSVLLVCHSICLSSWWIDRCHQDGTEIVQA